MLAGGKRLRPYSGEGPPDAPQLAAGSVTLLDKVSKVFGQPPEAVRALNGVSLAIERGEFVAVTGPSGSGKTTLLSILGGMTEPTEGRVMINGTDLYRLSPDSRADFRVQNIGFVFQQLHLLPYLTALENVMLPLAIANSGHQRERALAALAMVGLAGKERRLPGELSVGEQARVGIARALVREPLSSWPTNLRATWTPGQGSR